MCPLNKNHSMLQKHNHCPNPNHSHLTVNDHLHHFLNGHFPLLYFSDSFILQNATLYNFIPTAIFDIVTDILSYWSTIL